MAFRPAVLFVLLFATTALAGCSGGTDGDDGGYPEAYMLGTYGVPDGFELIDEESDEWEYAADQFELESNPGYANPESLSVGDDEEEAPIPERVYVALYIAEDYDPEADGFPPMIFSMAAEMAIEAQVQEVIDSEEDLCEDLDEAPGFMLRDGRYFAIVVSLAQGADQELADAEADMKAATGAEPICGEDGDDG